MKVRAKKAVLSVSPYQPGRPIEDVKRELGLKRVVKLASNETPYPPSSLAVRAIRAAARQANRYPDGDAYVLRQALAKHCGVAPEQLIFGNGSDEVIVMAVRAFLGSGDQAVMATPSFLIYRLASQLEGARVKAVPLKGFVYDLDRMAKAITRRTKIVFIGNPDNPAGTYVSRDNLNRFLRRVPSDVLVILDEAYFEYVEEKDYPNGVSFLKRYPNLLVTRTFSKMYGLAGLRIGYGIAHPLIVEAMNRVRDPFNVNACAQAAAVACLKDKAYYHRCAREIRTQRRWLYDQLSRWGVAFEKSWTNFILIRCPYPARQVARALLKQGVIVRDMSAWGLTSYIRVTIGRPVENRFFIRALKQVWKKVQG